MFDSVTNRTVKVPPSSILPLLPRMGIILEALEIESFHDLILTNDTEFLAVVPQSHADELERVHEFKDRMAIKATAQSKALSAIT